MLTRFSLVIFRRDVPFSIMFFPLNSFLKLQGADENGKISFSTIFGAGIVSGVVAASAVTPADGKLSKGSLCCPNSVQITKKKKILIHTVIKTRLQVARKPGDPTYKGIADCFQHIVRNEGVAALFKGVVPRSLIVAVSIPAIISNYIMTQLDV